MMKYNELSIKISYVLCDCRCYFVKSWIFWYFESPAAKKVGRKAKTGAKIWNKSLSFSDPFFAVEDSKYQKSNDVRK